jgi:hypothetical protein
MPTTITAEEPNLCGRVAIPIRVTDHVSRPPGVTAIQATRRTASNDNIQDMTLLVTR